MTYMVYYKLDYYSIVIRTPRAPAPRRRACTASAARSRCLGEWKGGDVAEGYLRSFGGLKMLANNTDSFKSPLVPLCNILTNDINKVLYTIISKQQYNVTNPLFALPRCPASRPPI